MKAKRIIPCLDIKDGKTVKGVNFENIKDVGDPVELAKHYAEMGADELVFLDITATNENRKTLSNLVSEVAKVINIPFIVGGGIASVEDAHTILNSGATKISIGTAALKSPQLIQSLAEEFGSEKIVIAIDTKEENGVWYVATNGGKVITKTKTLDWAKQVTELGAGEILLTSMSHDGTKDGFAIDITRKVAEVANIPVIASGGAGRIEDFEEVLTEGKADAALAASIFHYKEVEIPKLKEFLFNKGINVNQ